MKRFRQSSMPYMAQSGMGNGKWTNYKRAREGNPNSVNTGKGRVNKRRVMQLRYLQSKRVKSVPNSILKWVDSIKQSSD